MHASATSSASKSVNLMAAIAGKSGGGVVVGLAVSSRRVEGAGVCAQSASG